MKYVSCSKCMGLFKGNHTKIIEGVRVCSACKSKTDRELEKVFSRSTVTRNFTEMKREE